MKKRLSALVCALLMVLIMVPAQALTGEGTRAADILATLNIVRGAYNVNDTATRTQAAVILVRLAGADGTAQTANAASLFTDLAGWAKADINYAYTQRWVNGTTGNTFGGGEGITATAYCSFLMRMLGYTSSDFNYEDSVTFARHMGVISRNYSGTLTRGDLFELTAGALTAAYKDSTDTVISRLVSSGAVSSATANALGLTGGELTARQVADRYMAAVFQLDTYESQIYIDAQEPSANASGFFISADGLAVTNYHAINGAIKGVVTLASGEQYPVDSVIYYDPDIDIAVIRVSTTSVSGVKTSGFVSLQTASRDTLRAGDQVYTISNPLGLGLAISSGIVSSVTRDVDRYALPCIMSTADISQGSSGGALLNVYGQVVGVTSGAFVYGNNMYLAVPIDPVLTADLTGQGQTLAQVAAVEAANTEDAAS